MFENIKKVSWLFWCTSVWIMGFSFFLALILSSFQSLEIVSDFFLFLWMMLGFIVYPGGLIWLVYLAWFKKDNIQVMTHGESGNGNSYGKNNTHQFRQNT